MDNHCQFLTEKLTHWELFQLKILRARSLLCSWTNGIITFLSIYIVDTLPRPWKSVLSSEWNKSLLLLVFSRRHQNSNQRIIDPPEFLPWWSGREAKNVLKLWIHENHIYELRREVMIWMKVIAVIHATFSVAERKPAENWTFCDTVRLNFYAFPWRAQHVDASLACVAGGIG